MGSPAIFSGRRTKLLTADGILNSNGGIIDNNGIQNFITNGHGEVNTTGWATYADAAATRPVDGTAGAPALTFTRSTTTPLSGQGSFLITKDAVNRQGNGASYDFTIGVKDKAKVLQISFDYLVSSGTFVAGTSTTDSDLIVYIYDVTNAVNIEPSSIKLLSNSTTIASQFNATFQTASNSTSYRLIIHAASVSALAYVVQVDSVVVSPSTYVYGTPITDWVSYTPTLAGVGTATSVNFWWKRAGDTVSIKGSFITGTPTAVPFSITMPNSIVIDNNKATTVGEFLGEVIRAVSTATLRKRAKLFSYNGAGNLLYAGNDDYTTSGSPQATMNGNAFFGASETDYVEISGIPILGWSSSVQTSDQTDTRVVAGRFVSASASVTLNTAMIFGTASYDSHGAMNTATGSYTIPVSGFYTLSGAFNSTSTASQINAYVDGVSTQKIGYTSPTTGEFVVGGGLRLNAGNVLTIRPSVTATYSGELVLTRVSGPSAIAASESVNARYYASATSVSGTLATVSWTTKDYDSHGGMSAGVYTVQTPGKYNVNAELLLSGTYILNNTCILEIQKNGTVIGRSTEYAGGAITQFKNWIQDDINCIAGDTLRVQVSSTGTTPAIVSSNFDNFITIKRVGN